MAPKPTPPSAALAPVLPPVARTKPQRPRYSGVDSAKWNVRDAAGKVLAKGLDGFKSADKAARELGGTAVRA